MLAVAGNASAAPAGITFKVVRGGSEVGTHTVRFRDEGDVLVAESAVRIQVRLAGFTVYRYTHDTTERWQDGRLLALSSRLDRNGTPGFCEARAGTGGIALRGPGGDTVLPAEAAPLTWWRQASLRPGVPLFDPRKGERVAPRLEIGPAAGGTRVRVVGGEGAEILYDSAGQWVGFASVGEDGSAVSYRRA
jgi:hypothetical protein